MNDVSRWNRRQWLRATTGSISLAAFGSTCPVRAAPANRPRIAAVCTEFSYRSHAHVILENFLEPYLFNGQVIDPGCDIVSVFVDQIPSGKDMSRDVAKKYGFTIFPTIAEALRCGGKDLAVDGVLSIGEHGNYPKNDRRQQMYPRKRFFDEIVAVFRQSGRAVPLFNDKHLSYRWDWATEMMQVARELKIPFMAGSSVPLAQRRPALEIPENAIIDEAISIHGGGLESYDFHALEVLQSFIEMRRGGETGVRDVQLIEGDAVWKAAEEGRWSESLALAALRCFEEKATGPLREFVEPADGKRHDVHAILIQYRDGLKATVLRIGNSATRWCFACRLAGKQEPLATSMYVGPWNNRNLFKALSHAVQAHIRDRQSPYPVERTYLATGILASAMDSRYEGHQPLPTPHLDIMYSPMDFRAMREMGESWKIITEGLPEPAGIDSIKGRALAK